MRRTFSAKRNALISPSQLSWGAAALAIVLILLLVRFIAPGVFMQLTAPLFAVSNAVSEEAHTFISGFSDTAALATRNEQLVAENQSLSYRNQSLVEENASLSALLGTSAAPKESGVTAGVLARPPQSPYDTLVVAAGTGAGVTKGMEAFGPDGVPLGVVTEVTDSASRITAFSAPGATVFGWVGKSLPITLHGVGAGAFDAPAPRAANIVVGDTVFVPGPGKLPIGSVVRVDGDPSAPVVTLRVQPKVNLFSVGWVTLRTSATDLLGPLMSATSTTP